MVEVKCITKLSQEPPPVEEPYNEYYDEGNYDKEGGDNMDEGYDYEYYDPEYNYTEAANSEVLFERKSCTEGKQPTEGRRVGCGSGNQLHCETKGQFHCHTRERHP